MAKTVNAKLYKIGTEFYKEGRNIESFIDTIVEQYNDKTAHSFTNIPLNEDINTIESLDEDNNVFIYDAKLFALNTEYKIPDWVDFAHTISSETKKLDEYKNRYSSFLLFIYDDSDLFAISKGHYGHHLLNEYIDTFFGLDILSRLIDKTSTEIRQIDDRALFGNELGAQRYFRHDYNLVYDDDFGKIYKKMLASLTEDDFAKLGIIKKRASTNQVSISASSSLDISTGFTYQELLGRITRIKKLLLIPGVEFNQFYKLTAKELSKIKNDLNMEILKEAYQNFKKNKSIDFYHPRIFEYLNAVTTSFTRKGTGENREINMSSSKAFKDIVDELGNGFIDVSSEDLFIDSVNDILGSYKREEQENYVYEVILSDWFSGEVVYKNKKYFKIDGAWYLFKDGLDEIITNRISEINFKLLEPTDLLDPWNLQIHSGEGLYNESYLNKEGFIVTDRAYMSLIEVADLIKITADEIQFYHVKKGLGQDMRALSNQIINASRYLKSALDENDSKSLIEYFKSIKKKHYNNGDIVINDFEGNRKKYNQKDFIALLKSSKKKTFVFVYASKSLKEVVDEIKDTDSRIAKLSLIYTIRDMKRSDFEFKMQRILLKK